LIDSVASIHQRRPEHLPAATKEESMNAIAEKGVRELAVEYGGAAQVFEGFGIDYCCGGNQTLEQACHAANIPVSQAQSGLGRAEG
jgi:regulator of cell morphogenesis and NO signaling